MNSGMQAGQNELEVTGDLDESRPQTVLHLGAGRRVVVPTEFLLGAALSEPGAAAPNHGTGTPISSARPLELAGQRGTDDMVIPLIAEQMEIGKQTVTTGKVRLNRSIESFTDSVSLPLTRTTWDVERTAVGQLVETKPEPRQEGDVMIFPLVEERLVAKREYFLVEEVRVRQIATTTDRTASLELKRDVLTVERDA